MNTSIQNGTYKATTYDHFYDLSLPEDGNVFLEIAHNSGYSAIYDQDLNHVADLTAAGPLYLEAGSYVIHADYSSPTYGTLSVFAPQLEKPDDLLYLATGTYKATTYDHFYDLSLPEDGNVFLEIAHNSGYSAIYDQDLNHVADLTAAGPLYLEAGSYVIHADYSSPTYGTLIFSGNSVNGPILPSNNQTYIGQPGDNQIDGEAGIDVVIYSGGQNSYTLTLSPTSTTIEDRRADGNGTDELIDMELLDFDSGAFDPFDLTVFGGPTTLSQEDFESFIELYIAYFNRAPDAIGLNFWGTAFANGTTLEEMATLFIDQDETLAAYPPGTSNSVFAETVYNNVLGRTPDPAGFDFWVGQLDNGNVSRDQFILEVLRGVQPGTPDDGYLDTKVDIGAYFAVHKGMSDTDNASAAMALFDGTEVSINTAVTAIDGYYADALDPTTGAFLMQVVGVLDDPFAIA